MVAKEILLTVLVSSLVGFSPRAQSVPLPDGSPTVIYNGSGVNPLILSETQAPKVGMPWMVSLNCTGATPGKLAIFRIAFVPKPPPLMTKWGEILVSLSAGTGFNRIQLGGAIRPLTGVIPNDPNLACLDFQVQGLCGSTPVGFVSNALVSSIAS